MAPMKVAESLEATGSWEHPRVVAVGFFDGVHRGHQALLSRLTGTATARAGTSVVLTFDPHPAAVVRPDQRPALLTTLAQKVSLLDRAGVNCLLVLPFSEELRKLEPGPFVDRILVDGLHTRVVLVGFNFTFGHRGRGDAALLRQLASARGIEVEVVPPVRLHDTVISSTVIRQSLQAGQVERARAWLGRPHRLCGRVVRGSGRGRALGYPTCNLAMDDGVLRPALGVYAVSVVLPDGTRAPGVCNIGSRPTFQGRDITIEVHIIGRSDDWYGQLLCLDLIRRLRDELRFPGPEALVRQIQRDIARAQEAPLEADLLAEM